MNRAILSAIVLTATCLCGAAETASPVANLDTVTVALVKSLVNGKPEPGVTVRPVEQAPAVRFHYRTDRWSDDAAPATLGATAYVDDSHAHVAVTYRLTWTGAETQLTQPYFETKGLLALHGNLPGAGPLKVANGDVLTLHAVMDATRIQATAGFWLHASDPDGKPMDMWIFPTAGKP